MVKTIIWFIFNHFSRFGIKNFKIAYGYKVEMIEYFMNFNTLNSDFEIVIKQTKLNFLKKFLIESYVYNTV